MGGPPPPSVGDDQLLLGAPGMQAAHLRHVDAELGARVGEGHLEAVHGARLGPSR